MTTIVNFIKKHKFILFCLLVSITFLTITSKNSFIYPFNDWMDANAFFTVGKGMMHNVIPYKDLFEQKGPVLYVVYGIGYLLSNKTFHGVFILEIIAFTIFLYFIHKTISLFIKEENSYIILPILTLLLTTCSGFVHGGSCEEFCLPLFGASLYYYTKHFIKENLSYKELLINGIFAGCVLLTKYTLLGFWFAFMMFIFFDLFFKRKFKESIYSCIAFLAGMLIPCVIFLIYFLVTGALNDFIDCYFLINMSAYNESVSLITRLTTIFDKGISSVMNNGESLYLLFITIPIFIAFLKAPKYYKFSMIFIILITMVGLFWGLKFYSYYVYPLLFFIVLSMISILDISDKILTKIKIERFPVIIYVLTFVITLPLSYYNANYREMIGMKKEELFQYKYADYIDQFDNPTLLNMGGLDAGLYTSSGIIPTTRFFEVQNIPYDKFPDNLDEMKKYVENKEIMFVLYFIKNREDVKERDEFIYDYYDLVFKESQIEEHNTYYALLFKAKE